MKLQKHRIKELRSHGDMDIRNYGLMEDTYYKKHSRKQETLEIHLRA